DRAAVARALAKNPAERFPSCSDFVRALVSGYADVVVVAAPEPRPPRPAPAPAPAPRPELLVEPGPEPPGQLKLTRCLRQTPLCETWEGERGSGSGCLARVLFGVRGGAATR